MALQADDIMGTLSEQANKQGIMSCLIASDLDMLQLIDHDTDVYAMKKGFPILVAWRALKRNTAYAKTNS